ncbi:MAG: SH3 domain-containing protein [Devosiaceae bacterium]|nr:SH3 domain-containing protein [Devosiaceae bacterium MH13]
MNKALAACTLAGGLALALAAPSQANASILDTFDCGGGGGGTTITVTLMPAQGTANLNWPRGNTTLVSDGEGRWINPGDEVQFTPAGDSGVLFLGSEQLPCRIMLADNEREQTQAGALVDLLGKSLGGRVRSGPGTNFDPIDSLPPGEPVVIVRNTGVIFDGYPWFEISYSEGLTGFQWGGIMCSDAQLVPGVFQIC